MENQGCTESHRIFRWGKLGNIKEGRPHLGEEVPVAVYRVFEYAMYDVLCHRLGQEKTQQIMREAGNKAGRQFALYLLDVSLDLKAFLAQTAEMLRKMKIGILRVEKMDEATGAFTVTVGEDLDCSGLPVTGETVCNYDEGFLAGIFEAYTRGKYTVREVDCWALGDKICRFEGVLETGS